MKFKDEKTCSCGGLFLFSAYGEGEFGTSTCSRCGRPGASIDSLSVSVTAERLIHRSKQELEGGDYTLSIITAVMAVESYLTRLFLKLKGMANYAITFELPTESQEMEWEKEYPRSGGFKVPSDFVSQKLAGATFDKFVEGNAATATIFSGLPSSSHSSPAQYIQDRLFKQRNRIVHWGYVNSGKAEAEHCLEIAVVVVRILERMDKGTNWIELAQKMAEAARAGVAAERRHLHEILAERQQAESRE
jgi:HEPN domain-containing protein